MRLPPGKIPIDILKDVVFKNLGAERKEVAVGPKAGIDSAVINLDNKSIVISMDPITGALEKIGWLSVNVNANDVATFGVEPSFLVSCILLPEKAERKIIEIISEQMGSAAKKLGIAIIGGHCESTPNLQNPIVIGCAIGLTEKGKYVTAAGAKTGDKIILTKSAGIEGTAILASDRKTELERKMGKASLKKANHFYKMISVVKDATIAYRTGGVHAMHDPTEGGIAGGIHEMANAADVGFKVYREKIPVQTETKEICSFFGIDPIQLIGSGALLISAEPNKANEIIENLQKTKIQAAIIGQFTSNTNNRIIENADGKIKDLQKPESDHLWKALSGK